MTKTHRAFLVGGLALLTFVSPAWAANVASAPLQFFQLTYWYPVGNAGSLAHNQGYHMTADPSEIQVIREHQTMVSGGYSISVASDAPHGFPHPETENPAYVFTSPVQGTVPLYRYRNRTSSDHFFTTSLDEGNQATASFNYISEGICCYIFATQVPNSVPLWRLQSGGLHYYTASPLNRERFKAKGWNDEGIAGYVYSTQLSVEN